MKNPQELYKILLIKRLLNNEITREEAVTLASYLYEQYQNEEDEDVRGEIRSLLNRLSRIIGLGE